MDNPILKRYDDLIELTYIAPFPMRVIEEVYDKRNCSKRDTLIVLKLATMLGVPPMEVLQSIELNKLAAAKQRHPELTIPSPGNNIIQPGINYQRRVTVDELQELEAWFSMPARERG